MSCRCTHFKGNRDVRTSYTGQEIPMSINAALVLSHYVATRIQTTHWEQKA